MFYRFLDQGETPNLNNLSNGVLGLILISILVLILGFEVSMACKEKWWVSL